MFVLVLACIVVCKRSFHVDHLLDFVTMYSVASSFRSLIQEPREMQDKLSRFAVAHA